eukprot:5690318-Pyramimonas_sp.AAC.1
MQRDPLPPPVARGPARRRLPMCSFWLAETWGGKRDRHAQAFASSCRPALAQQAAREVSDSRALEARVGSTSWRRP